MTAPWMQIAWEQEGAGVAEIGGPQAHKSIVAYFHQIGRPDISSDEVAWCMAFVMWCLMKAGVDISVIAPKDRLLAYFARKLGTVINEPRVGAVCSMKRPGGHHTGFVTKVTKTHVTLLGGNQSNKVCEATFKRTPDMVFTWPAPVQTPAEVAQVSRISDAAGDVRKDAAKVGGSQGLENLIPTPPEQLPGVETLANHAGSFKSTVLTMQDFLLFSWGKVWWIAAALALFWLVRMAWNAGWIRWWRAEDANTGKTVTSSSPPEPMNDNAQWGGADVEAA